MRAAMRCHFCEHPACCGKNGADIPGILRRVAVGNLAGAKKRLSDHPASAETLTQYESRCIRRLEGGSAVEIKRILESLTEEQA
jgi:NADPH-dependent glutamate synthase beta subunit-like oxidoreductase